MRKEIQEIVDKIEYGEPVIYKIIKGRVPIVDGEKDWDNMETLSVEERVLCPKTNYVKNH